MFFSFSFLRLGPATHPPPPRSEGGGGLGVAGAASTYASYINVLLVLPATAERVFPRERSKMAWTISDLGGVRGRGAEHRSGNGCSCNGLGLLRGARHVYVFGIAVVLG